MITAFDLIIQEKMMERVINAPYQNSKLPVEERVKDLIARMTPEEKVSQLACILSCMGQIGDMEIQMVEGIGQIGMLLGALTMDGNVKLMEKIQKYLTEQTRLGIPALFHVETLNGAVLAQTTTYPMPIGMGASWSPEKVKEVAECIREETVPTGMRLSFAPVMDVARDPRWGRMGETYGENPTLCSAMSVSYIKGIQGDKLEYGMAATAKHFLGYAMSEGGINMAAAHITDRELREVYAKPFDAAIRNGNLEAVMNCYLAIDGEPVAGSKKLLTNLLRGELEFKGLTVADYESVDKLRSVYHIAEDETGAGILAMEAGLDTELPDRKCYGAGFVQALKDGKVDTRQVDDAVCRVLSLKFRLGLFEHPYADSEQLKICLQREKYQKTAYEMACESMVLLKNKGNVLPISPKCKQIAIIGPNARNLRNLFGGYSFVATYEMMYKIITQASFVGMEGVNLDNKYDDGRASTVAMLPPVEQIIAMNYPEINDIFQAVSQRFPNAKVDYAKGCDTSSEDTSGFDEAVRLAGESEIVILVLGGKNGSSNDCTMGENVDSSNVGLPGVQEELLKSVAATGKPIVLVHMEGRPLSSLWAKEHVDVILEAWHPGQCGSQAIADTLCGINNPGGKLPVTVVRNASQIPIYSDQMRGSGVLYKGITNSGITQGYVNEPGYPLWAFGHGLSYSQFEISDMEVSDIFLSPDGEIEISCKVKNTSQISGSEVVQFFFSDHVSSMLRPEKELAGFKRVYLGVGEEKKVIFCFHADQTAFLNQKLQWKVEEGTIDLMIGNASDHLKIKKEIQITGSRILNNSRRTYYCKVREESNISDVQKTEFPG